MSGLPLTGLVAFLYMIFFMGEPDEKRSVEEILRDHEKILKQHSDYKQKESTKSTSPDVTTKQKKPQKTSSHTTEKIDLLKDKGDLYERYIGEQFEKKDELVIYNGLIRGYEDDGVDVISICPNKKVIHLIQCKNWTKKPMLLEDVKDIYLKLKLFNLSRLSHQAIEIQQHQKIFTELGEIKKILLLEKNDYQIRKTLYIGSDKVIELKIGKYLEMLQPNIFKYNDMKIVIKELST